MELHILNPYQPMIRKYQLPFCNTTKGSLLTFLPILIVRIPFDDSSDLQLFNQMNAKNNGSDIVSISESFGVSPPI